MCYSVAFDPEGWKRASEDLVAENGIHSAAALVVRRAHHAGQYASGASCARPNKAVKPSKVTSSSTAPAISTSRRVRVRRSSAARTFLTTVFRLGGVDTEAAERFEWEEPEKYLEVDKRAKELLGGSWDKWWLKTPLPGIVWCNCPHMRGYDGANVDDLTKAQFEGQQARRRDVRVRA